MRERRPEPVVLTILDGWGYRAQREANAIALARKPIWEELLRNFPNILIHTSGPYVGLPEGQMGNSEVGHLNIGAGRIIYMDITRIDMAIESGEFFRHELLLRALERGRTHQLHLLGLVSDGGVHSHLNHLFALLQMAKRNQVERVFVHAFLDGRDTPPTSGVDFLDQLQREMAALDLGQLASVSGRYYAMDRDNRWERTEQAYRAIVHGQAEFTHTDPLQAVRDSYGRKVTDEFVVPIVLTDREGNPCATVQDQDAVIFFNFRADRARQLTRALTEPGFDKFSDPARPKDLFFVSLTQYDKSFTWVPYAFGPQAVENILANIFAQHQLHNLRVAETEKYAHVTYFFNGGIEKPFDCEERILIPSPKVATYDLKPEMSAAGITDTIVKAIRDATFEVIVSNFANPDMVGHSGKLEPTIKAVEAVDASLGRIYQELRARGGAWVITADHGNAETMVEPETGQPHTFHTTNPVPLVVISDDTKLQLRADGSLRDIAPTLLALLGLPRPAAMTGSDLRVAKK
ncbi:MAG: 2,3-bisphosphoglycerate-independent phosphoglycerate mutase [Acidobacteria bacterium]|nr:2,3-bisphosphoglycerate-independent phosphoglycerate mutase [Acidobacteriota bacterium]